MSIHARGVPLCTRRGAALILGLVAVRRDHSFRDWTLKGEDMGKTVLITGATGLIGSCACEQLIKKGDRARAIVRSPDAPDAKALRTLGVEIIPGDITDLKCVREAMKGADGVIHSAALRGLPGATVDKSFGPNTLGSIHLLTAAH